MYALIFTTIAIYVWLTSIGVLAARLYVIKNLYETRFGVRLSTTLLHIALILLVSGLISIRLIPFARLFVDTLEDALIRLLR
jgi:hypothetical protein